MASVNSEDARRSMHAEISSHAAVAYFYLVEQESVIIKSLVILIWTSGIYQNCRTQVVLRPAGIA